MNKIYRLILLLVIMLAVVLRISAFISNIYNIPIDDCHSLNMIETSTLKELFTNFVQGANFLPVYRLILKVIFCLNKDVFNYILLKLPSLFISILSVFVFFKILLKIFSNKILILCSLLAFTLNYNLIYNSARIKPYAFDVLICLIILNTALYIFQNYKTNSIPIKKLILYITSSVLFIFTSLSAIVITEIYWGILFIWFCIAKNTKNIIRAVIYQFFILSAIITEYFSYIIQMKTDESLAGQWIGANFYYCPNSVKALRALFDFSYFKFFWFDTDSNLQLNNYVLLIYIIIFFTGTILCLRKKKFVQGLFIISPVYFFILLSFLGLYPFCNRLIIFLIPYFIIITFKAFDFNGKIKILTDILAVSVLSFYIYHIMHFGYLNALISNNSISKHEKIILDKLENTSKDKIIISTETMCMYCINNKKLFIIPYYELKDDFENNVFSNVYDKEHNLYSDMTINDLTKNYKTVYYTYKLVDNRNNYIEKIIKLIEKQGYKKTQEAQGNFTDYTIFQYDR